MVRPPLNKKKSINYFQFLFLIYLLVKNLVRLMQNCQANEFHTPSMDFLEIFKFMYCKLIIFSEALSFVLFHWQPQIYNSVLEIQDSGNRHMYMHNKRFRCLSYSLLNLTFPSSEIYGNIVPTKINAFTV